MSDHIVTGATVATGLPGLYDAVASAIRPPAEVGIGAGTATYRFTPDLTAVEATTFADIVATFRTRDVQLTPAEYQAIKSDIDGLRTYNGITSPTLAQTVAATKAQNRILRALLRDG